MNRGEEDKLRFIDIKMFISVCLTKLAKLRSWFVFFEEMPKNGEECSFPLPGDVDQLLPAYVVHIQLYGISTDDWAND